MNKENGVVNADEKGKPYANNALKAPSRRKFLGQVGAALTGGALLGKPILAAAQSSYAGFGDGIPPSLSPRVRRCFTIRVAAANQQARIPLPPHTTNGDEERYQDKWGTYSKGVPKNGIGLGTSKASHTLK